MMNLIVSICFDNQIPLRFIVSMNCSAVQGVLFVFFISVDVPIQLSLSTCQLSMILFVVDIFINVVDPVYQILM